jgi:hypothetical protein
VPVWAGDPAEGQRAVAPLRGTGRPLADNLRPLPYLFLQSRVDGGNQHGMHWYWRSRPDVELAVGDLADPGSIEAVLEGSRSSFWPAVMSRPQVTDAVRALTGRQPRHLAEFLADRAAAFASGPASSRGRPAGPRRPPGPASRPRRPAARWAGRSPPR